MITASQVQSLTFIDQLGGSYGRLTPNGSVPVSEIPEAAELKRLGLIETVPSHRSDEMVALSGAGKVYVRDKT